MQEFIIDGGNPLQGTIRPQGNKNEALPVLCACLMNTGTVKVSNVPDIQDIHVLLSLLEHLGAKIKRKGKSIRDLEIHVPELVTDSLPAELTSPIRGSITLMAPVLARAGRVFLPRPGGDKIGRRRVDTHLYALEALGARVEVSNDGYLIKARKLKGAEILLDEASVTGTENAIMAAAVAEGDSVIENAASEPHVQGLCRFLISQGVEIDGVGSNRLRIKGVGSFEKLTDAKHKIGPDYLEVGSFVSMAAVTRGKVTIEDVNQRDLRMINMVFARLGIETAFQTKGKRTDLIVPAKQRLKITSDIHDAVPKIDDAPWPAFPADLISIALVTATQCKGTVLIHEKLFESRLFFVDKLIGMGASIVLCDPHRAVVIGPSKLHAAQMTSPDIRAGMALVIAALAAEGTSRIQNVVQIDRGYEDMAKRLKKLGAKIKRVGTT